MTLGELLENHKPVVFGIVGAGVLFIISIVAVFIFVHTGCGEDLDQTGEQFAQRAIETITTWDHQAILELMPEPAREQSNLVSSLKNSCSTLQIQLGERTGLVQLIGDAKGRFNLSQMAFATATYSGHCTFRNGQATVHIDLYKNVRIAGTNGRWMLLGVRYSDVGE